MAPPLSFTGMRPFYTERVFYFAPCLSLIAVTDPDRSAHGASTIAVLQQNAHD